MSTDRLETDFCCSDCNQYFESASQLLTHFALHASENKSVDNFCEDDFYTEDILQQNNNELHENNKQESGKSELTSKLDKKNVPDLYPIDVVRKKVRDTTKNASITNSLQSDIQETCISEVIKHPVKINNATKVNLFDEATCQGGNNFGVQIEADVDDFNPLKFCSITMEEIKEPNNLSSLLNENVSKKIVSANILLSDDKKQNKMTTNVGLMKKKYPCSLCSKVFGWSTDLKRHVLTHTGERPFKCKSCDASFTRNFLLQKHEMKTHQNKICITKGKIKMPNLNPISTKVNEAKTKDSRKQDKQKIKRKRIYTCENNSVDSFKDEFCGILCAQLNLIDKETIVQ